jgi:membrane associated rhomboid family serine protease
MRPFTERLSPTIRNLVIAESVLFGLYVMARGLREPIADHLALGPLFLSGEFWQPLTSLFVHFELWSFVFNVIGLWFVGATIERALGRRRFLLIFFGSGLAANLVVAGLFVVLKVVQRNEGCGDAVLALFVALGVVYGSTPVRVWGRLVLQARILAGILVGMSVLSLLSQAAWPSLAGTLVAIVLAYFLSGGKVRNIADFLAGLRRKRRTALGVLEGGRSKGGKKYVN